MVKFLKALFRRSFLLCLVSFLCCFLLGLVLFFPLSSLKNRAEIMAQRYDIILNMKTPQLTFPLGLKSEEVNINHPRLSRPDLTLSSVMLFPLWSTLFGDNPGGTYSADVWQGEIRGQGFRNGQVTASFSNLTFDERLSPQLSLRLRGELKSGAFDGVLPLAGRNRSQLQFEMSDLQLTGLQKVGGQNDLLPIGRINCVATAVGSKINIAELDISGPALTGSGRGTLRLGQSPATSSANLILEVTPGADFDPVLLDMLRLVTTQGKDGKFRIHLRGALNAIKMVK